MNLFDLIRRKSKTVGPAVCKDATDLNVATVPASQFSGNLNVAIGNHPSIANRTSGSDNVAASIANRTSGSDNVAVGQDGVLISRTCPECNLEYFFLHPKSNCKHGIVERIMET